MKRLLLLTVLAAVLCTVATAQSLSTEKLRRAVEATGIAKDTLRADTTVVLTARDGRSISVRTASDGSVEHVGIALFPVDLRLLQPSPIYDFLEYAALSRHYRLDSNQLYLSRVVFRIGSWQSLVSDSLYLCACSITNRDDKLYIVTWQRDGKQVAEVGIPIDYELLANSTRRKMERDFIAGLRDYKPSLQQATAARPATADLAVYGTGGLFVREGAFHTHSWLNQNVYYLMQTDSVNPSEVVPAVVVDTLYRAETFANLMMADAGEVPDVQMALDFNLSDYHHEYVTVALSHLRSYLRKQGCDLYFSLSGRTADTLRGILFITNRANGYNHLFRLSTETGRLTSAQPEVRADVYLYIPSIDKSCLYGKVPEKASGAIKKQ